MPCTSGKTIGMQGQYLVFTCPYTESIEGSTYSLSLRMDQNFFTNSSYLTISIPASGMNAKLTYDNNYNMNKV